MGAKTGLLIYADGEVPGLLRQVKAADLPRTFEMMRRLYPGWEIEQLEGSSLGGGVYPRKTRHTPRADWAWRSSATNG
ncbi:hypothetical protein OHA62_21725 [Streptomyces sp. NBC_00343]|nr:hypothetical protein [Streptomyces sp. NBC_00343]